MADREGQQLGNYRIIHLLGRGGFANVYLGEHIYLKTPVAIKLLQTKVVNKEDLDSFLKEAQTIARLVHPHIVRVLDFGVDAETPFLVMDYAANGTLRQRHPRGTQLPLTTIVPYIKQLAEALQHAHDEKLIHRDIKPENMLLGRRNEVLLSDFGIALIAQSSRYQSTQDVVGTVAYMSPEQIQGKPRPASDQYSLGIVVYEWLSGDRPFHGSFTELCTQHMFATPPPLHEKVPAIPGDVEQVVMMALVKEPKQRFMSVQAFANALEQASQSESPTFLKPPRAPVALQPGSPPRSSYSSYPPVQLASASPIPQTPPVMPPQPRGYMPPAHSAYPGQPDSPSAIPEKKVNGWKIGKRQIVAALSGAICGGLISFSVLLDSQPSVTIIIPFLALIALALVPPQFFGAVFGPWVGLFTGGVGTLVGLITAFSIIESHKGNIPLSFEQFISASCFVFLGFALVGFISGFATFKTKGRYNIGRTLGFGSLGVVAGTAFFTFIGSIEFPHDALSILFDLGISALISIIVGLILLPLLLLIYNTIANRIRHA